MVYGESGGNILRTCIFWIIKFTPRLRNFKKINTKFTKCDWDSKKIEIRNKWYCNIEEEKSKKMSRILHKFSNTYCTLLELIKFS
jgi:hypothetical protein